MEELQKWLAQLNDENNTKFERINAGIIARKILAEKINELRKLPVKKKNGTSEQPQPNQE
jgi:hypothetical protein